MLTYPVRLNPASQRVVELDLDLDLWNWIECVAWRGFCYPVMA